MSRWFRFYSDAMRNPKVARLTDKEFRLWVELLAVAAENTGSIPALDDLKHLLKRRLDHLSTGVERLISIGLIDALTMGYEPHNWKKFQYKSDTSTERVHKHRGKRNVSETPPETEADTEYSVAKATGASADPEKDFWTNAKAHVGGSNPGALIGKWKRDFGLAEAKAAITASQIEMAIDPTSFITATLRRQSMRAVEMPYA